VKFDIEEDNKGCQIQNPQMKNDENKEQITDLTVNKIFIFDLQKTNNCKSVRFGMQNYTNDMSRIFVESVAVFIRSLGVFTQSSKLWA
jgi:hypothetical protein